MMKRKELIILILLLASILFGCNVNKNVPMQVNSLNLESEVKNISKLLGKEFINPLFYKLNITTNPEGTISTITWEIVSEKNNIIRLATVNGFNGHYDILYNKETKNMLLKDSIPIEKVINTIQTYGIPNIFREKATINFDLSVNSYSNTQSLYSNFELIYVREGEEIKDKTIESNKLYLRGLYTFDNIATGREYLFEVY